MSKFLIIFVCLLMTLYILVALGFYFMQESILFHPVKTQKDLKYKFNSDFKENFYKTPNNGNIHSIKFFTKNPKGIVLYLHGNAGNLQDWAWVFPQYLKRNYDLEIIDYRTYGKSTGKLSEENLYSDVQFVYNKIQNEFPENKIIIHGRSLGTGMATKLASENNPKSLILESPYYNILDIAKNIAPFLPLNIMLKYKFESNINIIKIKSPIYILHGKKDEVIPFNSGLKLYNIVHDKALFIDFKEGTHSNLSTFKKYDLILDKILN